MQRITKGHGADVVLDRVGLLNQSLKCAAWCARLVTVVFVSGNIETVATNRVLLKKRSIVGIHWEAYTIHDPETIPRVWNELFASLARVVSWDVVSA